MVGPGNVPAYVKTRVSGRSRCSRALALSHGHAVIRKLTLGAQRIGARALGSQHLGDGQRIDERRQRVGRSASGAAWAAAAARFAPQSELTGTNGGGVGRATPAGWGATGRERGQSEQPAKTLEQRSTSTND